MFPSLSVALMAWPRPVVSVQTSNGLFHLLPCRTPWFVTFWPNSCTGPGRSPVTTPTTGHRAANGLGGIQGYRSRAPAVPAPGTGDAGAGGDCPGWLAGAHVPVTDC